MVRNDDDAAAEEDEEEGKEYVGADGDGDGEGDDPCDDNICTHSVRNSSWQ